jgi:hypothetical protein
MYNSLVDLTFKFIEMMQVKGRNLFALNIWKVQNFSDACAAPTSGSSHISNNQRV